MTAPAGPRGGRPAEAAAYPPEDSVGHQVRWAHRALQRELEETLRPYGITTGMWYFLRALWEEDGLTQRELSERVGITEPTTVTALNALEKRALVVRVPNSTDRAWPCCTRDPRTPPRAGAARHRHPRLFVAQHG